MNASPNSNDSNDVVSHERVSIAYSLLIPAYTFAMDQFKSQKTKSASLAGWIAAVLALTDGQLNTPMLNVHRCLLLTALVCFVIAFAFSVAAVSPKSFGKSAFKDPMSIYKFQAADEWHDYRTTSHKADMVAEHETKLQLIRDTDASIKALRVARDWKADKIFRSLVWFGVGMACEVAGMIMGPLSKAFGLH